LTYKELGEKIGYSESNLRGSVSQNKLSPQLKKSIELYLETLKLQNRVDKADELKDVLKTYLENLDKLKI